MPEGPVAHATLSCSRLVKRHTGRGGIANRGNAGTLAVAGVSLAVARGKIYGLVGRSGAGKSTLARMLALLERPDSGEVAYEGTRVDQLRGARLRRLRRAVQIVFQDPGASLDPLQRVESVVQEPLTILGLHRGPVREARVVELLAAVGLAHDDSFRYRFPRELSGGEQQRLAIARALACEPRALILDEPVSALDVSIRGQVLNLLIELRARFGLAMLLITHDLGVVAGVCDRLGVMLDGRIVEEGSTEKVLAGPLHPYTAILVAASTGSGPVSEARPDHAIGDPSHKQSGCSFSLDCSRAAPLCGDAPELRPAGPDHRVACYFPEGS